MRQRVYRTAGEFMKDCFPDWYRERLDVRTPEEKRRDETGRGTGIVEKIFDQMRSKLSQVPK